MFTKEVNPSHIWLRLGLSEAVQTDIFHYQLRRTSPVRFSFETENCCCLIQLQEYWNWWITNRSCSMTNWGSKRMIHFFENTNLYTAFISMSAPSNIHVMSVPLDHYIYGVLVFLLHTALPLVVTTSEFFTSRLESMCIFSDSQVEAYINIDTGYHKHRLI